MSPSGTAIFSMDAGIPTGFIAAFPLDTTGDPRGPYQCSGTCGECLPAWCILFVSVEILNVKYVAALLPLPSNMAGFRKISEV